MYRSDSYAYGHGLLLLDRTCMMQTYENSRASARCLFGAWIRISLTYGIKKMREIQHHSFAHLYFGYYIQQLNEKIPASFIEHTNIHSDKQNEVEFLTTFKKSNSWNRSSYRHLGAVRYNVSYQTLHYVREERQPLGKQFNRKNPLNWKTPRLRHCRHRCTILISRHIFALCPYNSPCEGARPSRQRNTTAERCRLADIRKGLEENTVWYITVYQICHLGF